MFIRTSRLLPEGQEQLAAAWHLRPPVTPEMGLKSPKQCTMKNIKTAWTKTCSNPPHSDGDEGGIGFDRLTSSLKQAA